ncbi:MAG: hypothetical protein JWQ24_4205 [Tardiphaga sp.]|nr:hypothetical protein [Tardiphaga sp.]
MRSIDEVEAGVGVPHAPLSLLQPPPGMSFASLSTSHPPRKGEGEESPPSIPRYNLLRSVPAVSVP